MYNKINNILNSMLYDFVPCKSLKNVDGFELGKGFSVNMYGKKLYVEICSNGDIDIWKEKDFNHLYTIRKDDSYVMAFELGWFLRSILDFWRISCYN